MLITIITIVTFTIGAILHRLYSKHILSEMFDYISFTMILASTIASVICVLGLLNGHTYLGKSDVIATKEKRAAIVSAMNDDTPVTIRNQLYSDIAEYNTKVRNAKHWANSPWTNWFCPREWNELEYIEGDFK